MDTQVYRQIGSTSLNFGNSPDTFATLHSCFHQYIMSKSVNDIKRESPMAQVTARLSEETINALDRAANTLHRTRADIIRQAIEAYIENFDDISLAIERLRDPVDETIDWQEARSALLSED